MAALAMVLGVAGCSGVNTATAQLPTRPPDFAGTPVTALGSNLDLAGSVLVSNVGGKGSNGLSAVAACTGPGYLAVEATAVDGHNHSRQTLSCNGKWHLPELAVGYLTDQGPNPGPYVVTATTCGEVRAWVVDVYGSGRAEPTPAASPPPADNAESCRSNS